MMRRKRAIFGIRADSNNTDDELDKVNEDESSDDESDSKKKKDV